jgi:hypothetical protein
MEEAIIRLQLAAAAGADVCFIEGVKTEALLKSTVAALAPKPVSRDIYLYLYNTSSFITYCSGARECNIWRTYTLFYHFRSRGNGCQNYQ